MIYNNLEKNEEIIKITDPVFSVNFINGPYLEVNNSLGNNFDILFIDKKTNIIYYKTNIHNNCWTRSNISYFVDWKIVAKRDDGEIFEFELKTFFESFLSSPLFTIIDSENETERLYLFVVNNPLFLVIVQCSKLNEDIQLLISSLGS